LDLESVSTHIFNYDGKLKSKEIKTLIRNGLGETYIPGSSIKGAIASALFHYLYNGVNPTYFNDQTTKELLGTFDRALGRYLRPSDSSAIETEINGIQFVSKRCKLEWRV
jgi:CRISPR/Cas system CSM-associated protein Csm5 (group 7 of RAMP superfamily)